MCDENEVFAHMNRGEWMQTNEVLPDDNMIVKVQLLEGGEVEAYFENHGDDGFVFCYDGMIINHEVKAWRWLNDDELGDFGPL